MQETKMADCAAQGARRWYGPFYFNRSDPRLCVPKRFGWGLTFNFARPSAWLIILVLLLAPAIVVAALLLAR
jgi:uncharacterized membrane protein